MPCQKEGLCINKAGEAMQNCRDGSTDYRDAALPLSEQLCVRTVYEHEPQTRDPYNKIYLDVCYQIDELLGDPIAHKPDALDARFRYFETRLNTLIDSNQLAEGNNGRYLYHINARVLQAFLGPLRFRAEHRVIDEVPRPLLEATRSSLGDLLRDFSKEGVYHDIAQQVALKRTEVEIPLLLLRTNDPQYLIWPALFREEASVDAVYNHDFYHIFRALNGEPKKVPVQIKTNDYTGRRKRSEYSKDTMMVIHQQIVNMDMHDQERIVTRVEEPGVTFDDEFIDDRYDKFDTERQQAVVWGAGPILQPNNQDDQFEAEFVQFIGGNRRDGLMEAILGELSGRRLSVDERNILNGATHFLTATLRENKQKLE